MVHYQNYLIKNQWYIPVRLPTVWSLAPKVKKSNFITIILNLPMVLLPGV